MMGDLVVTESKHLPGDLGWPAEGKYVWEGPQESTLTETIVERRASLHALLFIANLFTRDSSAPRVDEVRAWGARRKEVILGGRVPCLGRLLERLNFWVNFFAVSLDHLNLCRQNQVWKARTLELNRIYKYRGVDDHCAVSFIHTDAVNAFCRHSNPTQVIPTRDSLLIGY